MTEASAFAQDTGNVSGGYRFLRSEGENIVKGWYFDVATHLSDRLAIVGDVGGGYKTFEESEAGLTVTADAKVHTFMGGVRWSARASPTVAPFAQALGGFARSSVSVSGAGLDFSDATTDGLFAVDGGINVTARGSIGVRVQAGYMRVFEEDGSNVFRLNVGVVIPF